MSDGARKKRKRTHLTQRGQQFIDTHLPAFIKLSGDKDRARSALVKSILSEALDRQDELGSTSWSYDVVFGRLHNRMNKIPKEKRREMAAMAVS